MDNDKLLDLARSDFDRQERYSVSLQTSAQFILTLSIGIATASIAMFRVELITDLRASAISFWIFAALLWAVLSNVGQLLGKALRSQMMIDPRSLQEYLHWRKTRREGLEKWEASMAVWEKEHGKSAPRNSPEDRANRDVGERMLHAYADSACHNRAVNLQRQRFLSAAMVRVMLAAVLLGGQAVSDCWFLYNMVHGGTRSTRSTPGTGSTT